MSGEEKKTNMDAMMLEHLTGRELKVAPHHREAAAMRIANAGRAAHEARRLVAMVGGQHDYKPWDDCPARWRKDSLIEAIEIFEGNIPAVPGGSHQVWLEQKVLDGWTWGPVKDEELKQNPCIIDYDKLPFVERAKDYAGVLMICAQLGLPSPPAFRERL